MKLDLFQQQKLDLTLTTELKQAIELLQYSAIELSEFIKEQAVENPLIELQESSYDQSIPKKSVNEHDKHSFLNNMRSNQGYHLYDYLLQQASLLKKDDMEEKLLEYMIFSLDENGYFHDPLKEIARKFSVSVDFVEEMLNMIQEMEPTGVGARNLQECLMIQLKHLRPRNLLAEQMIQKHFTLFAEKKWKSIAAIEKIPVQEIQNVYDVIKTLNPKPGTDFVKEPPSYVIPDVIIEKNDSEMLIIVNDQHIPKISINENYMVMLDSMSSKETTSFLRMKYQQLSWLQKSIEKRKETLYKVMSVIIDKQMEFFYKGPNCLKPLTIAEVAEKADVHQSTVSRATNGKYAQTPYGVFELRYFFPSGVQNNNGTLTSSKQVKNEIKKLIEQEDKKKPLSDQKIVSLLYNNKGINVSRRTVTKYRKQLNIPSSVKRKSY